MDVSTALEAEVNRLKALKSQLEIENLLADMERLKQEHETTAKKSAEEAAERLRVLQSECDAEIQRLTEEKNADRKVSCANSAI